MIQTELNKKVIYNHCLQTIQNKIAVSKSVMQDAQNSANSETKSTSGDKHDTARAMAHLEQDKYARVLAEQMNQEKILLQMNPENISSTVVLGSLVDCTNGLFYLSISLGKCKIDEIELFALSAHAPLAKLLMGKKSKDTFILNGIRHTINAVY